MDVITVSPGSSSDLYSTSESDDPRLARRAASHDPLSASSQKASHSPLEVSTLYAQDESQTKVHGIKRRGKVEPMYDGRGTVGSYNVHKRKREVDVDDAELVIPGSGSFSAAMHGSPPINGTAHRSFPQTNITAEPGHKRSRQDDMLPGSHDREMCVSSLPLQIWQTIFCFVPPVFLGRLLRVNRAFNFLLTPSATRGPDPKLSYQFTRDLSPPSIWAASRKRFCPGLPRPLHGMEELEMWRLLRGSTCQLCGNSKTLLTSNASKPWSSGPGDRGVRVIWPFGVRSCGPCLRVHCEKEVTLLFSSTFPSFLLPALPFAFVSQSEDYVTSTAFRNITPSSDIQLTRHYYKKHIEDIKNQLDRVKELGPASAEEWTKGLKTVGKEKLNDSARWEQWEEKGGLKKVNVRPSSKFVGRGGKATSVSTPTTKLSMSSNDSNPRAQAVNPSLQETNGDHSSQASQRESTIPSASSLRAAAAGGHGSLPQRPQVSLPQLRAERNIHDVNEAKAARRAEIERRCMELDPPLGPNLLFHMETFQAALQISTQMTENAWQVLKPRLLAQREIAEQREKERIEQNRIFQVKNEEKKHQDAQLKEAVDKEWDIIQSPIRDRLGFYADEIIQEKWASGAHVTKDNCSFFAAEVLLHASKRFREHFPHKDSTIQSSGQDVRFDLPNWPVSTSLTLESMKWLFDNKVKTFTENFQKELFLCNGCEGNFKFYGFEGVIQHYAAKHTTRLSKGSVVVRWRADWPEPPPFHPNPSAAKAAYYAIPLPVQSSLPSQFGRTPQASTGFGEYGQNVTLPPQPNVQSYGTQPSPFPYGLQHQGKFHHQPYTAILSPAQYPAQHEISTQSLALQPTISYSQASPEITVENPSGHNGYHSTQENGVLQHVPLNQDVLSQALVHQNGYTEGFSNTSSNSRHMSSHLLTLPSKPVPSSIAISEVARGRFDQAPDLYQLQVNDMAKAARDVWFGTSGIKDIPQSVRIYVVIHHVVTRFAEKYTNEPTIAMFIDGLDHNTLMRPVRSLNGLACKTCVTGGVASLAGFHAHPQHTSSDRKLYTLPHLLNHFKSVHLERARHTIDLHTGLESSKLDWKQDMIELPETPLIADLINAPGMDDAKLKLVAWVFPGVFPCPLPFMGSTSTTGPTPRYRGENKGKYNNRSRDLETQQSQAMSYSLGATPTGVDAVYTETETGSRPLSQSSIRTSELVREDEYDPHRPIYYGHIVETRHGIPSNLQTPHRIGSKRSGQSEGIQHGKEDIGHNKRQIKAYDELEVDAAAKAISTQRPPSTSGYHRDSTAHGPRPGRGWLSGPESIAQKPCGTDRDDSARFLSEDGEVVDESAANIPAHRSPSPSAEGTAAERFLNSFDPDIEAVAVSQKSGSRVTSLQPHNSKPDVREPSLDGPAKHVERRPKTPLQFEDPENERRIGAAPPPRAWYGIREDDHVRHAQLSEDRLPFNDSGRSISRYSYTDDEHTSIRRSSPMFDARSAAHGINSYDIPFERGPINADREALRSYRNSTRRHQTIPNRSRSRSPLPDAREIVHHRARSPHELPSNEPIYRVRTRPMAQEVQAQRIVHYAYPPGQKPVNHTETRGYPIDQYRGRIEYIPMRAEDYDVQETARYVIAQPQESRRPIEQVNIDRGYAERQVYERDGRLYYAESRRFDVQPGRVADQEFVEYRENFR